VLVLDGETPYADYRINLERIAKRLGTSASGIANVNPFLRYGAEGDERSEAFRKVICNQEKAVEYIRQQLTTWPNALVIIDPLLEIIPFKETDTMAALKIYHALRGILADFPHASILFTLHLRKGDDNGDAGSASSAIVLLNNPRRWFKEVSGTNKIGAHADVRLGMCAVAGDEQHLVIKGFRRGKDVPIISFTKSVNGLGEYDGFCESPIPGGVLAGLKPDQISKLKALPFPFRFEEVADQQMPRATLHRLLKAAQAGGCAHKDETGLWQLDLVNEGGEQ
jgi:hypothetical protein